MIIHAECGKPLVIGIGGEDQVTAVTFDISGWVEAYGPGSVQLVHRRAVDPDATPVPVTFANGVVTWPITAADTAYQGVGEAQLIYTPVNRTKKSEIFQTVVDRALTSPAEVPIPMRGWVEQVLAIGAEVEDALPIVEEAVAAAQTVIPAAEAAQASAESAARDAAEAQEAAATFVTDPTLSILGKAADAAAVGAALADISYQPVAISSFSVAPSKAEKGSTIQSAALAFALNKVPASLTLDGGAVTPAKSGTITLTGQSITADKTWTLRATDSGSPTHAPASATKTAKLSFLNSVYWGAAAEPETLNSAFLLSLSDTELASARGRTLEDVNAGAGLYVWYALPSVMGACTFTVDGFSGGFTKKLTFQHTNAHGHAENYDVYRSDYAGLGTVTVVVS